MVTIEQKLLTFSNILNRSMNEKLSQEMERLRKEYSENVQKSKEAVDREADEIINKMRKRAEMEKTELLSKIRINMKKEYMSAQERLFLTMFDHLIAEIKEYIKTDKYGDYLISLAEMMAKDDTCSNSLDIYMTTSDLDKHSARIKERLLKLRQGEYTFKSADDGIIGGFIALDTVNNIRFDFSIKTLLEDNKSYMMQVLFKAIGAGDVGGTA